MSYLKNTPYRASKKSEGKNGKTYWNQVGLTVWLGEYNGQPTVSLVDERTGERYACFPPKQQQQQRREVDRDSERVPGPGYSDDYQEPSWFADNRPPEDDDVPF